MQTKVICPGSFDPVTLGHIDIITRASKMFDRVVVGVLNNLAKTPMFSTEERIDLLRQATENLDNVEIVGFDGLLADYAREHKPPYKFAVSVGYTRYADGQSLEALVEQADDELYREKQRTNAGR